MKTCLLFDLLTLLHASRSYESRVILCEDLASVDGNWEGFVEDHWRYIVKGGFHGIFRCLQRTPKVLIQKDLESYLEAFPHHKPLLTLKGETRDRMRDPCVVIIDAVHGKVGAITIFDESLYAHVCGEGQIPDREDGTFLLAWDINNWKFIGGVEAGQFREEDTSISASEEWIAIRAYRDIEIWGREDLVRIDTIEGKEGPRSLIYKKGNLIYTDGSILRSFSEKKEYSEDTGLGPFEVGKNTIVVSSGVSLPELIIHDLESGELITTFESPSNISRISALELHPQGETAWVGDRSGRLRSFDLETGESELHFGGDSGICSLRFNKNGSVLFMGNQDGELVVWDQQKGKSINVFRATNYGPLTTIVLDKRGGLFTHSNEGGRIRYWEISKLLEVRDASLYPSRPLDGEQSEFNLDEEGHVFVKLKDQYFFWDNTGKEKASSGIQEKVIPSEELGTWIEHAYSYEGSLEILTLASGLKLSSEDLPLMHLTRACFLGPKGIFVFSLHPTCFRIWDGKEGTFLEEWHLEEGAKYLLFTTSNRFVVIDDHSQLTFWEMGINGD